MNISMMRKLSFLLSPMLMLWACTEGPGDDIDAAQNENTVSIAAYVDDSGDEDPVVL